MAKKNELTPLDLLILERLDDREKLPDSAWITPQQVGLLMGGRSVEQLEDDRKAGTGPKWAKPFGERGAVRYRMGAVRDFMFGTPEFNNTLEMRIALGAPAFASFGTFMAGAGLDDTWPFLVHKGVPVDFFESLTLGDALSDDDRAVVLSLDEYLSQRKAAAVERKVNEDRTALDAAADEAAPDLPSFVRKRSTP
ncbi:hypothetical protein C7401_102314 [Paraburkholderia unamae]|uniref:hypothetical protein n=1 Tax=Paraburkholderia unamae TaxID=219649 RepID=UPI000DC57C2F|nr:hypothetical protein [Paraburkholderia unamae]RAR66889.1 hypothetical protein C7401_102314 [Paraburkholderia unamae]